jgi:mannose-6-phosphate isomerase-like protein (cupin superfamily)
MSKPNPGETVLVGSIPTKFEVTAEMVAGAYCIVRQTLRPGQLFWPHVHQNEDQVIFVVRGTMGVRVGEKEWTVSAGEIVYRPKRIPHTVWNAVAEPLEILEITSPGTFEQYFIALSEATGVGASDKREQILRQYQIAGVLGWDEDLKLRYGVQQ